MDKTLRILLKIILGTIVIGIILKVMVGLFSFGLSIGLVKGMSQKNPNKIEEVTIDYNENNEVKDQSVNGTTPKVESNKKETVEKVENKTGKLNLLAGKSKNQYYKEFDEIEAEALKIDENSGYSTPEMKFAKGEIYKLWDDELNIIYNDLKKELPKEKFAKLEKEEIKWIKYKENEAQKVADEYEGGSMMPIVKVSELAKLTKERCYELINQNLN